MRSSFLVNVLFSLLFLLTIKRTHLPNNKNYSFVLDVSAQQQEAALPSSSFVVYPIPPGGNNSDTSVPVFVYPISSNLTITLNPLGLELLDNVTIYPIDLDTTILTSQFPISYHKVNSLFFSVPFSVLESILPASGYNVTYDVIVIDGDSGGSGGYRSGHGSSLVFVSSDANSSTILVTTDSSDGEGNTWSRHVSRNASTYVASSILGFLFLTVLILFICSYNDPTFMSSSSYPIVTTTTTDRPLLKKKKKKHHHHHKNHSKKKNKKKSRDSDSSSSSSSSSSDSDDNDTRV